MTWVNLYCEWEISICFQAPPFRANTQISCSPRSYRISLAISRACRDDQHDMHVTEQTIGKKKKAGDIIVLMRAISRIGRGRGGSFREPFPWFPLAQHKITKLHLPRVCDMRACGPCHRRHDTYGFVTKVGNTDMSPCLGARLVQQSSLVLSR